MVLIIDDDTRNTFALGSYLKTIDMIIETAENGKEAIEKLEQGLKPDVILLDMMMPVLDGYETLAALKQNGLLQTTPVIATTAKAMKGDKEKCTNAGAWDYVSKPIDLKLLIDKMNQWVV